MSVNEDIRSLQRRLDVIIDHTETDSATAPLGNGDQALFIITTSSNSGAKVLVNVDVALYVGSVSDATQLPGGGSVDESQYQVIGPFSDWDDSDGNNNVHKIYVRNISAGSVNVLLRTASRVIVNSATPSTVLA